MQDRLTLQVEDQSQVAGARRAAGGLARSLGMSDERAGRVELLVTELATNLVKHGGGGELLVRSLACRDVAGVEVLSLDRGPGMASVAACMRDGYSSSGTKGEGLGAVARLADLFDVHSAPGLGTALLARVWGGRLPRPLPPRPLVVGAVSLPHHGETVCGDGWSVDQGPDRCLLLVADGLGHGQGAAEAAQAGVAAFQAEPRRAPAAHLQFLHGALRPTRGAAVSVAEVDTLRRQVRFAGVGNVGGTIWRDGGRQQNLVTHNGTIGQDARRIQEFAYEWPPEGLVVLYSDGLGSQWSLDAYPGIAACHPVVIAGVLYRDHSRRRDDVTVVVLKAAANGGAAR